MANVIIDDTYLTGIANAIRTKTGGSDTYTPAEMATAIGNLSTASNSALNLRWQSSNTSSGSSYLEIAAYGQNWRSTERIVALVIYQINGPCYFITKGDLDRFLSVRKEAGTKQRYIPITTLGGVSRNSNMDGWSNSVSTNRYPVIPASYLFEWNSSTNEYNYKTWSATSTQYVSTGVFTILPEDINTQSAGRGQSLSGTWYCYCIYEYVAA